jgi:hypothetical protein
MDAIIILVQHSAVCKGLLNMQDVAVLHCVSKTVHVTVDTYISTIEVMQTTARELCVHCENIHTDCMIDMNAFLRLLMIVRRLQGDVKQQVKFRDTLDNLTKNATNSLLTQACGNMSKSNQLQTVRFLLECMKTDCLQKNIIIIYILMSFLSQLIKSKKQDILNTDNSIFSNRNFRDIVVLKCLELTRSLREEITLYPYVFIDRTIRKIGEVKRKTLSLS